MPIPAWQVITWSPVVATVDQFARSVRRFRHLGTSVHVDERGRGLKYGQVLWGVADDAGPMGVAWDWAEVDDHVIALADPMKVLSNLNLVNDDGSALSESHRIVRLNTAIHALRWQDQLAGVHDRPQPRLAA